MVGLVIIAIIASILSYGFTIAKQNLSTDKVLWIILATTGYALFSYHYHGLSSRELRALLTASLFLVFFPRHIINEKLLSLLIFIGSLITCSVAFYYGVALNLEREAWPINAIPQATISAVMGITAIVILFTDTGTIKHKILPFLTIVCSLGAVILSQTRGIWLGYSLSAAIIFIILNRKKLFKFKLLFTTVALLSITGFSLKPVISERIYETQQEIKNIQAGNLNTSIGLRLQMWLLSPYMIEEHELLGLGNTHVERLHELKNEGIASRSLFGFHPAHYHNQYIDRAIKNGLLGLFLLLALLIVPGYYTQDRSRTHRFIICGISLLYAIASLTDVPFNHSQTLLIYLIFVCMLNTRSETEESDAKTL
ncbi:O-antigen ligase [Photobacterium aphoticum]|uniref:O-antigen ligase n=1 Tax=Photobacterium aphoticum TaxID=754436 RepID=A0A090QV92_9GAMM|nr:O-antigen ligase [Photobacterium aphoticum]